MIYLIGIFVVAIAVYLLKKKDATPKTPRAPESNEEETEGGRDFPDRDSKRDNF